MKSIFTLLITAILCTSLFAQKDNIGIPIKSTLSSDVKPDSTFVYAMDDDWELQWKYTYTYIGNMKETMNYSWDTISHSWELQIKTIDTYNEKGERINQFRMAVNPISSKWDTLSNHSYTYDDILGISSWDYDTWNQSTHSWNDLMKGEYNYFPNGRDLTYLLCQWNGTMSRWDSIYFAVWIMNIEGKDSTGAYYRWTDQSTPRYLDYNYYVYYDENGNDTLFLEVDPIDPSSNYRGVYTFNNNGLRETETSYHWDNNGWLATYRTEYVYDVTGNVVVTTSLEWDEILDGWSPQRKEQHYYPIQSTIGKNPLAMEMVVYPNPASDFLMINNPNGASSFNFRLYNAAGIKVMDQRVYGPSVPVGHLPKGVYLFQVDDEGRVLMGKVLLK